MVRTTIRFSDELLDKIREKAYNEKKSINTLVVELVSKTFEVKHDINKIKTDKFVGGNK